MAMRKGFRRNAPCPIALLAIKKAIVVPLASDWGRATNPIYDAPPGRHPEGRKLVDHWPGEHESSEFRLRRCDGVYFITAKVLWTRGDEPLSHGDEPLSHAYVNVWAGRDAYGPGTLYCSIAQRPGYEHCCLCGRCCRNGWQDSGWMCQNVST